MKKKILSSQAIQKEKWGANSACGLKFVKLFILEFLFNLF